MSINNTDDSGVIVDGDTDVTPIERAASHRGDARVLLDLLPYLRPHSGRIGLALALILAAKVANLVVPMILKRIVDGLNVEPSLMLLPVALLVAYASFALACVVGITYVLLFKELKAKHLGFFCSRLPSLRVLDVMNGRAVTVGWIFLTLGLVVGAIWLLQVQSNTADPRVQAMTLLDPKIFIVLVCWAVYSFALYARQVVGWSGRRAALLSAIGFTLLLLNFVPIGYFVTESHNFYD